MTNEELFSRSEEIVAQLAEKILIATCASDLSESAVERINGSFYLAEEFLKEVSRRRRGI